jgi:hypothetical protein
VPDQILAERSWSIDPVAGRRFLGELYLLDLERFEFHAVESRRVDGGFAAGRFARQGHGDVDVLEDQARGDAEDAFERFDEVVPFTTAVLAAEMVDEAEGGAEFFGFD